MKTKTIKQICLFFSCAVLLSSCASSGSPYGSNKDATTDLGLGSSEVIESNWKKTMKKLIMIGLLTLTLGAFANMGSGSSTIGSGDAINSPTANPRAASDNGSLN